MLHFQLQNQVLVSHVFKKIQKHISINIMTGGLMQLVAYGAQDIYLTGNPMITYFKTIYRRHTNFATEVIQQSFNGATNFGKSLSAIISRNGDLMSNVIISADLPELVSDDASVVLRWTDNVGHHLLKTIEIEIGGQLIDKHFGDWLDIWAQLTVPAEKQEGYYTMIGQDPVDMLGRPTGLQKDIEGEHVQGRTVFIPLQFWFCRNYGLALPLIALSYHEVKINVEFAHVDELIRSAGIEMRNIELEAQLWVEYIYLDDEERRRFAQTVHEYLIEQVQRNTEIIEPSNSRDSPNTTSIALNFVHPVKELIWVVQPIEYLTGTDRQNSNYTAVKSNPPVDAVNEDATDLVVIHNNAGAQGFAAFGTQVQLRDISIQSCVRPPGSKNPVVRAKLRLNGNDRIATRLGTYFNWVQPRDRHTCIPKSPGINVYSFALLPEKHQPSGSCNFSRIDNAFLVLSTAVLTTGTQNIETSYPGLGTPTRLQSATSQCRIYAVNYNVLRIMQGMGGLAYRH